MNNEGKTIRHSLMSRSLRNQSWFAIDPMGRYEVHTTTGDTYRCTSFKDEGLLLVLLSMDGTKVNVLGVNRVAKVERVSGR